MAKRSRTERDVDPLFPDLVSEYQQYQEATIDDEEFQEEEGAAVDAE